MPCLYVVYVSVAINKICCIRLLENWCRSVRERMRAQETQGLRTHARAQAQEQHNNKKKVER